MKENDIKDKWAELLDYAKQHATGEGFRRGYNWLRDSFNEYIDMTKDTIYSGGGQPGSMHNREVLAERICLELGHHVGGRHLIDEVQEAKLKDSLKKIVQQGQDNGIRR
jgi:hypothetical protein